MDTLQIIARNTRHRRGLFQWSQEELGERAGLHRTYIGAIERGERNITIRVLDHLAIGLSCSVAELVTP